MIDENRAPTIYTGGSQALDVAIETPYQDVLLSLGQCIIAWVDENASKSGSKRTEAIYRATITQFRKHLAAQKTPLDLDSFPAAVANVARQWLNKGNVSWATFNQRRSILSSFYKFAILNEVVQYNPIERIPLRDKGTKEHAAHALPMSKVKAGLASIDRSSVEGLRDYALLSIAVTTAHRAGELAGLRLRHLAFQGDTCTVTWEHCKGNQEMTSILKRGATTALYAYLTDSRVYGNRLLTMPGDAPVWLSFSDRNHQDLTKRAIGTRTISNICKAYLGTGKVHATRHTAAVALAHQTNERGQKATLEQIRQFLGHKNAKTTSDYLEEQLGYENPFADEMEAAFGI